VRYTTTHRLAGQAGHVLRPRIFVYMALLLALISGVIWAISDRTLLRADLLRDRNALYRELPNDMIENVYTLKLINMDSQPHHYFIEVLNNDDIVLFVSPEPILEAEEVGNFILRMQAPADAGRGSMEIEVRFMTEDAPVIERTVKTRFLMPF
jgi:polyferredoxin